MSDVSWRHGTRRLRLDSAAVRRLVLLGLLAVAALWVIGVGQAFAKGGSWILAVTAFIVGAMTIVFGLYQASLMVGDFHWVVQVTHLVLGILTIGLGHMGAARFRKAAPP